MLKRRLLGGLTAIVAVLFVAGLAGGSGAGAVSFTQHFHNATATMYVSNPCNGQNGTLTVTYNGAIHGTVLTSGKGVGTGWFTGTMTGTFVFTSNVTGGPSVSGKMTSWFGASLNLHNNESSFTLAAHGTTSDGFELTLHIVTHIVVIGLPSNPQVVVSFFDQSASCTA